MVKIVTEKLALFHRRFAPGCPRPKFQCFPTRAFAGKLDLDPARVMRQSPTMPTPYGS
jgi:hypothetical protein